MRNTRGEYFTSAMPSITDIARTSQDVRVVSLCDIGPAFDAGPIAISIVTSHSHALRSWCSVSFVLASHSAGAPAGGTAGVSSHAGTTRGAAHARSACFADLSDHFIRRLNGYGGQSLCCGRQGQSKGNSSQSDHRLSPSLRYQLVMRLGQRMDKARPSLPKALSAPPRPSCGRRSSARTNSPDHAALRAETICSQTNRAVRHSLHI